MLAASDHHRLRTCFNDSNLGCGRAVTRAVSWFFQHEEPGIILEDDCLPSHDFFRFCEDLLEIYATNETVMMISGNNFLWDLSIAKNTYTFSRYPHLWGWASWRRAWEHFDYEMTDWSLLRKSGWLREECEGHRFTHRYWRQIFDAVSRGDIDTWDYQWVYAIWKAKGISVIPPHNLVESVGFGQSATHTSELPTWFRWIPRGSIGFPLETPVVVEDNPMAHRLEESHIFQTRLPLNYRIMRKLSWMMNRS